MRDERDVVYIHKIDGGNSAIRMFSRIGMRLPLYCTGVGKAILATWPRSEARAVWEASDVYAWTEHTITDEEAFFPRDRQGAPARLRARQRGERGGRPLHRGGDTGLPRRAFYAISLSAPTARMADERIMQLRGPLLRASRDIAQALGAAARDADEGDGLRGELHPVKLEHSPNI